MTDDFAAPPGPGEFAAPPAPGDATVGSTPAGTVKRTDFRPQPPRKKRTRFPRWVTVLLVVGGVAIAAGVVAQMMLSARNANLTQADSDATGRLRSAQVVPGMCIESLGESAGTVHVVPCEQSHSAEAVTAYTFSDEEWPGDAAVKESVLAYCTSQLAPGGPLAHAADGRDWVAWLPSAGTWQHGDRTGLCIVTSDTPWQGKATDEREHSAA